MAQRTKVRPGILKEIEADAKQYGDERRTLIQAEKKAVAEVRVIDEPVTVVVSLKGWVRARQGHGHDPASFAFKAGDGLYGTFECRTVDTLLAFGSNGRVYSVPVSVLPALVALTVPPWARTRSRTTARPMPRVPPATTATRPDRPALVGARPSVAPVTPRYPPA